MCCKSLGSGGITIQRPLDRTKLVQQIATVVILGCAISCAGWPLGQSSCSSYNGGGIAVICTVGYGQRHCLGSLGKCYCPYCGAQARILLSTYTPIMIYSQYARSWVVAAMAGLTTMSIYWGLRSAMLPPDLMHERAAFAERAHRIGAPVPGPDFIH